MRIALDPIPLVLGIYAYVGTVLGSAVGKLDQEDAEALGRRLSRQRGQPGDKDAQKLVRVLHSDVKVADKLLKKTDDVWKISQETDLVDLVIGLRGSESHPRAYVLLKPRELRPLLVSIRGAAAGAGESAETLDAIDRAAAEVDGLPAGDYLAFGFDSWTG
jgi:hypothetical protein